MKQIYNGMISRCYNPKDACYVNYGARGIEVCERWLKSYADFCIDIGERPNSDYSIERIDNNGNYEPSNCKWATKAEQNLNKRNNVRLTYDGKTLTVSQWIKELGFRSPNILHNRIKKLGWSTERALSTPVASYQKPS